MILTQEFVFAALDAEKAGQSFPIDFDNAWKALGYSRKDNAVANLKEWLEENIDWVVFLKKEENSEGRPSIGYKLSVEAFKMFCMMARTAQGRECRKYFIDIEKAYRDSLERSLNQEPDPEKVAMAAEIAQLKARLKTEETKAAFPRTLEELHEISRIVVKQQVRDAVKDSFKANTDYVVIGKKMLLTESTFNILVLSFRSLKGTDIARLPAIIKIETEKYFQYHARKRKNTRVGQRECPGQMSIPGSEIW